MTNFCGASREGLMAKGTSEQGLEGSEGVDNRHEGPGNRSACGLFKEQQGSKCDWSTLSSKDSEGGEVFTVTGNAYRSRRTL